MALVERFYEEIWNNYDKEAIPELLHEDFTFRGSLGQEKKGRGGFSEYLDFVHAALGGYKCEIQETISEGSKTFARVRFSGVHRNELLGFAPTGKRVEWAGAALFTVVGGKIKDLWVLGDVHGLLEQLRKNASVS